ncbi:DUF58 domain-containing protein [Isobaculum melis]
MAFNQPEGWFLVCFLSMLLFISLVFIFPSLKPWEIQLMQADEERFMEGQPFDLTFLLTKDEANYWCYPFLKVGIDFEGTDEGYEEMIYPVLKKTEAIYFQQVVLKRGCYQHNALLIEAGDPFGLIVKHKKLQLTQAILVYPAYLATIKEEIIKKMIVLKPALFQRNDLSDFQLKNIRPYQLGDPIQQIDWKISAKQQDLYTKEYEQEKNESSYAVIFYGLSHGSYEGLLSACYSVYDQLQAKQKVALYLLGQFDSQETISYEVAGFAKIKPSKHVEQLIPSLKEGSFKQQHLLIFTPSFTQALKEFVTQYSGKEAIFIILPEQPTFDVSDLNCSIITLDLANNLQNNT